MSKLDKIEKIYGKDFGVKDGKKLTAYLRKKGWHSLAELIGIGE